MLCYALLAAAFLCVLIARCRSATVFGGADGVDGARVQQVERRIDPNVATWAELASLPEIGEVLAKRIVAYRDGRRAEFGAGRGSDAVFCRLEDLDVISGIGPKTLAKLDGHLKFPTWGLGSGH